MLSNRRSQRSFEARCSRIARSLVVALVCCTSFASITNAATCTVTATADTNNGVCNADCSLRQAVIAANDNSPSADTIIVPAGLYTLTRTGAGDDAADTGDLDFLENATVQGTGFCAVGPEAPKR